MLCRQLSVHASWGILRLTKLQGARKAAWVWLRGKPLLAAYESFRLSKAQLQRSRFHGVSKLGHPNERDNPRGEEDVIDASPTCGGDSKTALPRESQKDKRPLEAERAQWEPLGAHLVAQGMSELSAERLYHAMPIIFPGETKVKRRYPTSSMPRRPVLFVLTQDRH